MGLDKFEKELGEGEKENEKEVNKGGAKLKKEMQFAKI